MTKQELVQNLQKYLKSFGLGLTFNNMDDIDTKLLNKGIYKLKLKKSITNTEF